VEKEHPVGLDVTIILKWMLNETEGRGLDFSGPGLREVRGCCERGDELPSSINSGNFLIGWETISFSRTTLLYAVSVLTEQ
jgi:hypothetical protein